MFWVFHSRFLFVKFSISYFILYYFWCALSDASLDYSYQPSIMNQFYVTVSIVLYGAFMISGKCDVRRPQAAQSSLIYSIFFLIWSHIASPLIVCGCVVYFRLCFHVSRVCVCLCSTVHCDVSSLDGVKTFPSTTVSSNAENSNSFSILTKEFLNKPDDAEFKRDKPRPPNNGVRNLAPFPMVRVNGLDANNLGENDGSGERRAYYYNKPSISFDDEDKGGASSNVQTSTLPPKR